MNVYMPKVASTKLAYYDRLQMQGSAWLDINDLKAIDLPKYPQLSTTKVVDWAENHDLSEYLPVKDAECFYHDRAFVINICNSLRHEEFS